MIESVDESVDMQSRHALGKGHALAEGFASANTTRLHLGIVFPQFRVDRFDSAFIITDIVSYERER